MTEDQHISGRSRGGRVLTVVALVFAVLSLLIAPLCLGAVSVVVAIIAFAVGDRRGGAWAAATAVVCAAIGQLLVYYEVFPRLLPGTFG